MELYATISVLWGVFAGFVAYKADLNRYGILMYFVSHTVLMPLGVVVFSFLLWTA